MSKTRTNLLLASERGKVYRIKNTKVMRAMPDCPGLHFLFVEQQRDGRITEHHGVFGRMALLVAAGKRQDSHFPQGQLVLASYTWPHGTPDIETLRAWRSELPERLCALCPKRSECLAAGVVNGIKTHS